MPPEEIPRRCPIARDISFRDAVHAQHTRRRAAMSRAMRAMPITAMPDAACHHAACHAARRHPSADSAAMPRLAAADAMPPIPTCSSRHDACDAALRLLLRSAAMLGCCFSCCAHTAEEAGIAVMATPNLSPSYRLSPRQQTASAIRPSFRVQRPDVLPKRISHHHLPLLYRTYVTLR